MTITKPDNSTRVITRLTDSDSLMPRALSRPMSTRKARQTQPAGQGTSACR